MADWESVAREFGYAYCNYLNNDRAIERMAKEIARLREEDLISHKQDIKNAFGVKPPDETL